ncbi:MAG TPA: heavy metal translocating P-type ATPase [Rhabdochlamydiaceae bacterium]|jgi:heavy metal translocating P-type ATPase
MEKRRKNQSIQTPYIFDEFFASGKEESISPFLTHSSRHFAKNLSLKVAIASALLLLVSFVFSFIHPPLSSFLLLFVYFFAGTPAFLDAISDLKNFEINIDVLMTFAALLSVVIGSELEGALLLVLFELSGALEAMVSEKTKNTVLNLHKLSPRFACVLDSEGTFFDQAIKEVPLGAHLLIRAGEIIPLDGTVIDGGSFVNLVHLTGESHPVAKKMGDEVQAGARNLDGTLTIRVTRTSGDSTLNRIIELITQAQEAKPRVQRYLDRFGKGYAIVIMSLSFVFALSLPFLFSLPFFGAEGGIYRALAFLIAASPCALIIATPTAYLSAISACARSGILLKGGVVLDAIARCKIIAFDKTGTLTTGKLTCLGIEQIDAYPPLCSPHKALSIAYSLERHAVHPIAEAIVQKAMEQKCALVDLTEFKALAGSGLQGICWIDKNPTSVFIGHEDFILPKLATEKREQWQAHRAEQKGKGYLSTLLLVGDTLFQLRFFDSIRPESAFVIERLQKAENMRPLMLTGDHHDIAQVVAQEVGIEDVHANLRPEDKLHKVALLSEESGLIMVGDGINDAPALARATVGISMGKIGSATAVDASDVVFLNDDLSLLDWLCRKAKNTLSIVKQNIIIALCIIAFATTPALLGLIPLWLAVILHEGGTVLVGMNSLRLLRSKK